MDSFVNEWKQAVTQWKRRSLWVAGAALLGTVATAAPPANDDLANATAITITGTSGTVTGSNVDATTEVLEPVHGGVGGGASAWWGFDPTTAGYYKFNTSGSNFDTVLGVYLGNSYTLIDLGSNNDADGSTSTSAVGPLFLNAFSRHTLAVDGASPGTSGSVSLNWYQCSGVPITGSLSVVRPLDGQTVTSTTTTLEYLPVLDATDYDVTVNGVFVGSTSSTLLTISGLVVGANTVSVLPRNDCFEARPVTVNFNYCPDGTVTPVYPLDGLSTRTANVTELRWTPNSNVTTYVVTLDSVVYETTNTDRFDITFAALAAGNHRWSVYGIVSSDCTPVSGADQNFTLCDVDNLFAARIPPANRTQPCLIRPRLEWVDAAGYSDYAVYLNGQLVGNSGGVSSFELLDPLSPGTYEWYVVGLAGPCGDIQGTTNTICVVAEATALTPADGSTTNCGIRTLSWSPACDWGTTNTFYTVEINGLDVETTTGFSVTLPSALPPGPVSWRVKTAGSCGFPSIQSDSPNTFCVMDTPTTPVLPTNGAILVSGEPTVLEWNPVCGATTYTVSVDATVVGSVAETSISLTGFPLGSGSHRWLVLAEGDCQTVVSPLWNFCTLDEPVVYTFPPENAQFQCPDVVDLEWRFSGQPTNDGPSQEFDVYLDDVYQGTAFSEFYSLGTVSGGTHTYRVDVVGSCGITTGSVRTFCVIDPVSVVRPAAGAIVSCSLSELSWDPACGATSYTVFLDGLSVFETTGTTYTLPSSLAPGNHRWVVVSEGECGPTTPDGDYAFCVQDRITTAVSPLNGETTTALPTELRWAPVCGADEYQVVLNGSSLATTTDTVITGLSSLYGTNTWSVIPVGTCGRGVATDFTYCVTSPPVSPVYPVGNVVRCESSFTLFWDDAPGALGYDVYLDDVYIGNNFYPDFTVSAGVSGGNHTWRVDVIDACGATSGTTVSFCAADDVSGFSPFFNETTGCAFNTFRWSPACGATSYAVVLDGIPLGETADTQWVLSSPLSPGAHSWEVSPVTDCGTRTPDGSMRFCIQDSATTAVTPANGETTSVLPDRLEWTPVCGATEYSIILNGVLIGTTTDTVVTGISPDYGTNTWSITPSGECGASVQTDFTFCVQSPQVTGPVPGDGTTLPCFTELVLRWGASTKALTYDVYFDGSYYGTTANTFFSLPALVGGGTHTWRIDVNNDCSSTSGTEFYFCAVSGVSNMVPADGETTSCAFDRLSWDAACGATSYSIILDGNPVGVTTDTQWLLASALSPGNHSWEVRPLTDCGAGPADAQSFCIQDSSTSAVTPFDGETTSLVPDRLEWTAVCGAYEYIINLNGTPVGTTTDTVFFPTTVAYGSNNWSVTPVGNCGVSAATAFQFCVLPPEATLVSPFPSALISCSVEFDLQWSSPGATAYNVYLDGALLRSATTDLSASPGALSGGKHEWRVDAIGPCGITTGTVSSFCIVDAVFAPSPFVGETTACSLNVLRWAPACGASSYSLVLDGTLLGETTDTKWALGSSLAPGLHSWSVSSLTDCGARTSDVSFEFCIQDSATSAITPLDTETTSVLPDRLEWSPVCGATSYEIILNGVSLGTTTETAVTSIVPNYGSNTWSVIPSGTCGLGTQTDFTFCVGSPEAIPLTPVSSVVGCGGPITLEWSASPGAAAYDVYFDGLQISTATTSLLATVPTVTGGNHTWRVDVIDTCGVTTGTDVQFCAADYVGSPSPALGETTGCALNLLAWAPACGASSYTVVLDGTPLGTTTDTQWALGSTLSPGFHYWTVWTLTDCGARVSDGSFSFCVQDSATSALAPLDGESLSSLPDTLQWSPICGASFYEIILNGVSLGLTTDTLMVGVTAQYGTNSWSVIPIGTCGRGTQTDFTFCVRSPEVVPIFPVNTIVNCGGPLTLEWAPSPGALAYDVYIDSVQVAFGTTATEVTVPSVSGGRHDVHIDVIDACGISDGSDSSFCAADYVGGQSPASGETTGCSLNLLSWAPACGASSYTVVLDGTPLGTTTDTQWALGTALAPGFHSWTVWTLTDCGARVSDGSFGFCVQDSVTTAITPFDGETTSVLPDRLEWSAVCGATDYEVILNGVSLGTTSETSITGVLPIYGTNTWSVVPIGTCGRGTSTDATFCVGSPAAVPVYPVNSNISCGSPVNLEWGASPGAVGYDVYFDGVQISTATTSLLVSVPAVSGGSHSWRVDVRDACGVTTGSDIRFCAADFVNSTSPTFGETTGCGISLLSWAPACGASSYTVVLDSTVLGSTTDTQWVLSSALTPGFHTWNVYTLTECGARVNDGLFSFCVQDSATTAVTPLDGETTTILPDRLEWTPVCGATDYEIVLNGVTIGTTTDTVLTGITPIYGTNVWSVIPIGSCGRGTQTDFTFCVRSPEVSPIRPLDGSLERCFTELVLQWNPSPGAVSYDVYYDDVYQGSNVNPFFSLASLITGGTHTWRVDVNDECGSTSGTTFSFCAVNAVSGLSPFSGETTACSLNVLTWESACGATSYSVILDGTPLGETTSTQWVLASPLSPGNHSWEVRSVTSCGALASDAVTGFCIQDSATSAISPFDTETTSILPDRLVWTPVCGATDYEVILNGVSLGTTTDTAVTGVVPNYGSNTWSVVPIGTCGRAPQTDFTFCVGSPEAIPLTPVSSLISCGGPITLEWSASPGAAAYDVYFDGVQISTATTLLSAAVPTVTGGNHSWRVDVIDTCGVTTGTEVHFCAADFVGSPSPASGETTGCSLNLLSWAPACGASSYTVVLDGTPLGSTTDTQWVLGSSLSPGFHSWTVWTLTDCGARVSDGSFGFCVQDSATTALFPLDGETTTSIPDRIEWSPVCGATAYEIIFNGFTLGTTTDTVFAGIIPDYGPNTWSVIPIGACGRATQTDFTFCLGSLPVLPFDPVNGIVRCSTDFTLQWDISLGATSYDVYVDDVFVGNTFDTTYTVTGGVAGGSHSWRVDVVDKCGTTSGTNISFCAADTVTGFSPADNSTTGCGLTTLSWNPACGATSYSVVLDGSLLGETTDTRWILSTPLSPGTHRWDVRPVTDCGPRVDDLIHRFCIQDPVSTPVTPYDGESTAPEVTRFEWNAACGATDYVFNLDGTDLAATTATSVDLAPGTVTEGYHQWYVVAIGPCGRIVSPTWTFCQAPAATVINFPTSADRVSCGERVTVSWDPSAAPAAIYELFIDSVSVGVTSNTEYIAIFTPGTHRLRVDTTGTCAATSGTESIFCVSDETFVSSPFNGETTSCNLSEISWLPACGVTTYTIVIDGTPFGSTTGTSIAVAGLSAGPHDVVIQHSTECLTYDSPNSTFCLADAVSTPVTPPIGDTVTTDVITFEWLPACGASSYQVFVDGSFVGSNTVTSLTLAAGSIAPGPHTWYVMAVSDCGGIDGPSWDFCYVPSGPRIVAPVSGQQLSCEDPITIEAEDLGFESYNFYINGILLTTSTSPLISLTANYPPGCVDLRVDGVTSCGISTGAPTSITVISSGTLVSPLPTATLLCGTSVTLEWTPFCGATTYTVFLDAAPIATLDASAGQTYTIPVPIGTHTWFVEGSNECGGTTVSDTGTLVGICEPPTAILPPDGTITTEPVTLLSWTPVCAADYYDVYLDGSFLGSTTDTQWSLAVSPVTGGHTWGVIAQTSSSVSCLPLGSPSDFDFCIIPTAINLQLPADCAVFPCGADVTLAWDAIPGSSFYDVVLNGTTIASISTNTVTLPGLVGAQRWSVIVTMNCGPVIASSERSFTVLDAPLAPTVITDNSCSSPIVIDWAAACGATTYTVVVDGLAVGTTTGLSLDLPGGLGYGTHAVSVQSDVACGTAPESSATFVCIQEAPLSPVYPADGTTVSAPVTQLQWTPGCSDPANTSYTVVLDGSIQGTTTDTTFILGTPLVTGDHSWHVEMNGPCGVSVSAIWTFSVVTVCPLPGLAGNPVPLDAPSVAIPCGLDTLSWSPAVDTSFYVISINGSVVATTNSTSYQAPAPFAPGAYTWRVDTVNACGTTTGTDWHFCVMDEPQVVSPVDGQTSDCAAPYRFVWTDTCGALSYQVNIDNSFFDITTATEYILASPLSAGAHTFRVTATGTCAVTSSTEVRFCLQGTPVPTTPANNAVLAVPPTLLQWNAACGATSYTVLLDGSPAGDTALTQLGVTIAPGTGPHTWQVIAAGTCGETTGPVWTFSDCASLAAPTNPVPFDGETTGSALAQLSWSPVFGATSYQVFLGGSLLGVVPGPSITLPGTLPDGLYSWQVVAVVPGCGSISGPLWTFNICDIAPAPVGLSPLAGVTTRSSNILFEWTDVPGTISYRVVVDSFVSGDLFQSDFQFGINLAAGPHTWAPVSRTSCAYTTATAIPFCVVDVPSAPNPANGDFLCKTPTQFSWNSTFGAIAYDVILDGQVIATSVTASQIPYTGELSTGVHTWQVVTYVSCGSLPSDLWTFEIGDRGLADPFAWMTNGIVNAMASDGENLYIGGEFTTLVNQAGTAQVRRSNLAAVSLATGLPTSWAPAADGAVHALAVSGSNVYVGGDFLTLAGVSQTRLGAVTRDTGVARPFDPSVAPNATVRTIAITSPTLYFGGDFTRVGAVVRRYAGAVDTDSLFTTAWNPNPDSRVRSIAPDPSAGVIYMGGTFSTVGGTARQGLAALDSAGNLLPWNANCDLYVYGIWPSPAGIYVCGFFNSVGFATRQNAALLSPLTGTALPWNPRLDAPTLAILPLGTEVYVAGLFNQVNGDPRPYLARISASTSLPTVCGYDPDYPVRCLLGDGNRLWIGGEFTYVGSQPVRGMATFGPTTLGTSGAADWMLFE